VWEREEEVVMNIEIAGLSELVDWLEETYDNDCTEILLELTGKVGDLCKLQAQLCLEGSDNPQKWHDEVGEALGDAFLLLLHACAAFGHYGEHVINEQLRAAVLATQSGPKAQQDGASGLTLLSDASYMRYCPHCTQAAEIQQNLTTHELNDNQVARALTRIKSLHAQCEGCACEHTREVAEQS
jgi:hypothetical protein